MEDDEIVVSATEIIKGRLYFASLRSGYRPKATRNSRYFHIEDSIVYESFYLDFGPYHICHLYQFCRRLRDELSWAGNRKLVFYTSDDEALRLNAACLIGCYQIIYLERSPEAVYAQLTCGDGNGSRSLLTFRDASGGPALFHITLLDVFRGLHVALQNNFFDFDDFNEEEYLHYETVENGDLNWIVPGKMLAFSGPHARSRLDRGYPLHSPDHYHHYFRRNRVTTVVRLNKKSYEAAQFTAAGFQHKDLYFIDGSVPSDGIVDRFVRISEAAPGAVAVHCKAGLGRTGTLIACYMMKHYNFTAREAIAWLRLCRPGSVIGHQQWFLENIESRMHAEGALYRRRRNVTGYPHHAYGIYSIRALSEPAAPAAAPADPETAPPVSLHTILNNNCNSNTNRRGHKLDNGNTLPSTTADSTPAVPARVRHYMLPTSSAVVRGAGGRPYSKTSTFPPARGGSPLRANGARKPPVATLAAMTENCHLAASRRKPPPRTSSITRKKFVAKTMNAPAQGIDNGLSSGDTNLTRGRRKRDKSESPDRLALPISGRGTLLGAESAVGGDERERDNIAETLNSQGNRLYKIKALRSKCPALGAGVLSSPASSAPRGVQTRSSAGKK